MTPTPSEKIQRHHTLTDSGAMETLPEREFDELAQLAATVCQAPMAFVAFLDESQHSFKALWGFEVTDRPRNCPFCQHTIDASDSLVVHDTTKDARFADNPLVSGASQACFYAGIPLRAPDGRAAGVLAIMDRT